METFDFIIYGNNTAAIVSAIELSKEHSVAIINPFKNWGGHFSGMSINNINYDIGMNFFEFTSFHNKSVDISTYQFDKRNDSARFFELVKEYISNYIDVCEVTKLESYAENIFSEDIAIANNLEILEKLPQKIKDEIIIEIKEILKLNNSELHASNKKTKEELFLTKNLFEVSVANHGITFHNIFIEPLCNKILNLNSTEIPAIFHRIAWSPLFYPETILDFMEGRYTDKLTTKFHFPKTGSFSDIILKWKKEIESNTNISIFNEQLLKIENKYNCEIELTNNLKLNSKKIIWCSDLKHFLDVKEIKNEFIFNKASIIIMFFTIENKNLLRSFSVLNVFPNETAIYRITNLDYSASSDKSTSRIVIELNKDYAKTLNFENENDIINHINAFLLDKIINIHINDLNFEIKFFNNAVVTPTKYNIKSFNEMLKLAKLNNENIELIGSSANIATSSFNDQLIHGLYLQNKYSKK
jgi:hypothetical protein